MFRRRQPTHNRTALTGPTSADSSSTSAPPAIGGGGTGAIRRGVRRPNHRGPHPSGKPHDEPTITASPATTAHWNYRTGTTARWNHPWPPGPRCPDHPDRCAPVGAQVAAGVTHRAGPRSPPLLEPAAVVGAVRRHLADRGPAGRHTTPGETTGGSGPEGVGKSTLRSVAWRTRRCPRCEDTMTGAGAPSGGDR